MYVSSDGVVSFSCNRSCAVCSDEANSCETDGICFWSTDASFETGVSNCSDGTGVSISTVLAKFCCDEANSCVVIVFALMLQVLMSAVL